VSEDGSVTLWATTSTSSSSGDNGADPNKVVTITDKVSAATLTGNVAEEQFKTVVGPTYGIVYRGVAYAADNCHRAFGNRQDCDDHDRH
jgi:hypothetical protein